MYIAEDRVSGEQYYMPDNETIDESKYKRIDIPERNPLGDLARGGKDLPIKGTVPSTETPSWLMEKLSGLKDVGSGVLNSIKDAAGSSVGGYVGATLGGAIPLALANPELIPAGAYAGGIAGSMGGQAIQDFITKGAPDLGNALWAGGADAVLGPLGQAAKLGISKSARSLGLTEGLTSLAQKTGQTMNMQPLYELVQKIRSASPSLDPEITKKIMGILGNLEEKTANRDIQGNIVDFAKNASDTQQVKKLIGDLADTSTATVKTDVYPKLYKEIMDILRREGYSNNNPAALYLLQQNAENSLGQALSSALTKGPLATAAGVGSVMYGLTRSPLRTAIAASIPPALLAGGGAFKAGLSALNPYMMGAAPLAAQTAYDYFNPKQGQ